MSPLSPTDTERFWSSHLAAIERCGASVAEYAREHGLSAQSLYGWRRRLAGQAVPVSFAEVLVTPTSTAPETPVLESAAALSIAPGTTHLLFPELPPPAWLAEFLAARDGGR